MIFAFMVRYTIWTFPFVFNVTVLLCCPILPDESNTTSTDPFSPGEIGSLLYFGTVHPQLALASKMTSEASPSLVNMKL